MINTAPIGELCTFKNGGTPQKSEPSYWNGTIPWITSADIVDGEVHTPRSFITEEAIRRSATNLVSAGTILLVTRTGVGKIAQTSINLCFSQDITAIEPDPNKIDTRYLIRFLEGCQAHFSRSSRGATIKGITREAIETLKIPLPSLKEQRRIAAILDKADALRQKRRISIKLASELVRSTFHQRFEIENSDEKHFLPLDEICEKITDGTHQAPNWSPSGIPFLFVSNIRNQKISFDTTNYISSEEYSRLTKNTPIETGDVLYTAVGSYGHAAVVPSNRTFAFQRHIAHLKPKLSIVNPYFLSLALEAPGAKRQADREARGVAQKTVTLASLKKLKIPLPPIRDQENFANFHSKVLRHSLHEEASLNSLDAIFTSLQHLAFSGKL